MKLEGYRYIIVGAGIFGAAAAERLASAGNRVLVIERREHIAGNVYSETDPETGIEVHKYGSHIFHTESDEVWEYVCRFGRFNSYVHTVKTRHEGKLYPMPVNLDTVNLLYGTDLTAEEAETFIAEEAAKDACALPSNLEEKGISLVGKRLYEAFIKHYTEKQWNRPAASLPADILKRIPVRFLKDDRYFPNAKHQGIPEEGYTKLVGNMLDRPGITVKTGISFREIEAMIPSGTTVIYCGQPDELLGYCFGPLPWRSLRFEEIRTEHSNGCAVINEADADVPYTRTHDFKYYQVHQPEVIGQPVSILCREYPADYRAGAEAYYPVNTEESEALYQKYRAAAAEKYPNLILGGRLGAYRYWDMDKAVAAALELTGSGLLRLRI